MKEVFRTTRKERVSFALFMAGQSMFNQFVNFFVLIFLTNAGIAAVAVGTISLFTRVFDAVNDPVFGGIIDRSRFRGGKFLPWLRLSNILLPLFLIFIFFMPAALSPAGRILWAFLAYVFYSMAYTICDVPIFSMVSAITDGVQERVTIMSHNTLAGMAATLIVVAAAPLAYPAVGWRITALITAVLAAALMVPMGRNARERYLNKDPAPVTLKAMFHYVRGNRYLLRFFGGLLILNTTNTTQAAGAYFAAHNLGNPAFMGVLSLLLIIPMLFLLALLPHLTKRFDKFTLFRFFVCGLLGVSVISYFAGYENSAIFFLFMIIRGFFWGGNGAMMLMFTSDFIEYGEFSTGKRLQGTAYSVQTFVCKLMTALSGTTAMFFMGAVGFIEGEGAVQSAGVLRAIWALVSLFPAFGAVLSLPFFLGYKLRDRDVQIMAKANSGEITREAADAALAGRYRT
ncbi:MAG: MFS transporter [Treponema sp.]|jgi:probable glucitol transport protein GutA|nr:MFS transporter [Treponema sp.]